MTSEHSIYIPYVNGQHTVDTITAILRERKIGIVSFVDFTAAGQKRGFIEAFAASSRTNVKSAYVHFELMETPEAHTFWQMVKLGKDPVRLDITSREYWLCFKNHCPIARARMTVHQVVDNCRFLEERIEHLEALLQVLPRGPRLFLDENKVEAETGTETGADMTLDESPV